MRWTSPLIVICCCTSAFAQADPENSKQLLLEQVKALNERLEQMDARLAALEEELKEVHDLAKMTEPEKHRLRFQRRDEEMRRLQQQKIANQEKLSEIEWPEDPNRAEIALYIRRIINSVYDQNEQTPSDLQIEMLIKVGPDNLDLLLNEMNNAPSARDKDLTRAINLLIEPEKHKPMVLERLATRPMLISVVRHHRWLDDAKPIMLEAADGNATAMAHWVSDIIDFKDPKTYPTLIRYMESNHSPSHVYGLIKNLPGIELDAAIDRIWKKIRSNERGRIGHFDADFGRLAVKHGSVDALGWAIDMMSAEDFDQTVAGFGRFNSPSAHQFVVAHIDYEGAEAEVKTWFYRYRDRLKFDKEAEQFRAMVGDFDADSAAAALEQGDADALEWAVELLDADDLDLQVAGFDPPHSIAVRQLILKHMNFEGTDEQIKVWYYKHRHRLKFDKKKQYFKKPLF